MDRREGKEQQTEEAEALGWFAGPATRDPRKYMQKDMERDRADEAQHRVDIDREQGEELSVMWEVTQQKKIYSSRVT